MINICIECTETYCAKFKKQKFCSTKCARLNRYPIKHKICKFCNKNFQLNSVNKNNNFCSLSCFKESQSLRIETVCKHCKTKIHDTPSKSKIRVFCSNKCKYESLSEDRKKMIGKKNPNYKNGKNSSLYRRLAKENFPDCCMICSVSGKRIEVHHIDQDRTNNIIENLINLCCSCHLRVHGIIKNNKLNGYDAIEYRRDELAKKNKDNQT